MSDSREQGVHSVNQEYRRYEQVNKEQIYGLSENDAVDEFDDDYQIRICDMADYFNGGNKGRESFAHKLGQGMEEIGFTILVNHGIDTQLFDAAEEAIIQLFETVPMEQRLAYLAKRHGSINQGYFPIKETTIIHPDLVEGWVFCRRAFNLDNQSDFQTQDYWPEPEYEPIFRSLVQAQEALIKPLMQSILLYLGVDPHSYDRQLTKTNFGFRLNYYPALNNDQVNAQGGRMLGHEDVDLFTFLPTPKEEGLQVYNRQSKKWIRLKAPPGSIILNTGDYIQRITNDRLPSTTHRVARPQNLAATKRARVSFPMAVYVWEDEILEVLPGLGTPKYPPIRAEEFHTKITSKYYGDDYTQSE